jgi:hypothetical protein
MRRVVWIAVGLAVAAGVVFASRSPLTPCFLAQLSSRRQIAPGVFVEPDMPASERARLAGIVRQAERRIPEYLGDRRARPRILTSATRTATYRTPFCDCIYLGPQGRNVDVVAHEMAHTELTARTGYWRATRQVPTWFDEGMALHVDLRPVFGEKAYRKIAPRRLADMETTATFHSASFASFVTARHEYEIWYARVGRAGLLSLLEQVRRGRPFTEAYAESAAGAGRR